MSDLTKGTTRTHRIGPDPSPTPPCLGDTCIAPSSGAAATESSGAALPADLTAVGPGALPPTAGIGTPQSRASSPEIPSNNAPSSSFTDPIFSLQPSPTVIATGTSGPSTATGISIVGASSSSSKGGSNLSGGAVAGITIAALIVGAGLAFAAAFFFFKRRNNKTRDGAVGYNNHNYTDSSPELVMMQKSAGRNSPYVQVSQTPIPPSAPVPVPAVASPPKDIIGSILPAAAHDNEIQGRVSALFGQIHRHVDMYYRDVHASITPSMEPELVRFGAKDVNMAELLQDCSTPTTALKHALAAYVLGITSPKTGDEGETLFPEELKGAQSHNNTSGSDSNLAIAQTLHRRLSVYLYTTALASPSSPTAPRRRSWSFQSEIREAAEHFSLTFFPWANPGSDDQEKEDDLTRVISEALDTRIWLYGQPAEYEFRWDGVGTRGVVVSPELVRGDGQGGRGRVLVESGVAGL